MPDFEEMYYTLMRASEEALRIMIEAQKKCGKCKYDYQCTCNVILF